MFFKKAKRIKELEGKEMKEVVYCTHEGATETIEIRGTDETIVICHECGCEV